MQPMLIAEAMTYIFGGGAECLPVGDFWADRFDSPNLLSSIGKISG